MTTIQHTQAGGADLLSMIEHRESVPASKSIEAVYESFRHHPYEFAAVLSEDGKFLGLVSRGQLGFLLGSRYGFAIHGRQHVEHATVANCLAFDHATSLLQVLDRALSRQGEEFYQDVAVLGQEDSFLGIISVQNLVRKQSELILEQSRLAEARRQALEEKNRQLYGSLEELRLSRGRFDILFENSALGVALLNGRGIVEVHNRRFETLLALGEPQAAEPINLGSFVPANQQPRFLSLLHAQVGQPFPPGSASHEFTLNLPQRGPRLFKFFPQWIEETGQLCLLLDDISEQRVLERQLAQREKSALLDSLVGGIAHELNNKLSPIIGYAELLALTIQEAKLSDDVAAYCDTILQSSKESAKIIKQLLQLSRPLPSELRPCDLHNLIAETQMVLHFRVRHSGTTLLVDLPPEPTWIMADAANIKQVILNLALNAIDAMDQSPQKYLRLAVSHQAPNAVLEVSDTGHGISPENLTRIFDPFFTTKSPDRGTGLGLTVSFSIIRQHGGELTVSSAPGQGATFRLALPLTSAPAEAKSSTPAKSDQTPGPTAYRVLVADDEDWITKLIQEILQRRLNCRVDRVNNGRTAQELLAKNDYDLLISDIRMPGLDGFGLVDWIEQERQQLKSRTLLITGDAGGHEMDQRLTELGVPVLRKPFTQEELIRHCRQKLVHS